MALTFHPNVTKGQIGEKFPVRLAHIDLWPRPEVKPWSSRSTVDLVDLPEALSELSGVTPGREGDSQRADEF